MQVGAKKYMSNLSHERCRSTVQREAENSLNETHVKRPELAHRSQTEKRNETMTSAAARGVG